MKSILLALVSTFAVVFSIGAFAQQEERLVLRMHDQVYRGESTIPLKRLIQQQHPSVNLNRYSLKSVRLVAKSRRGGGHAQLVVGNWRSFEERIDGREGDWNWNDRRSFDRDNFYYNSRRGDQGRWQLQMRGRIKVRRIVVFVERERRRGPRVENVRCSSHDRRYRECHVSGRIVRASIINTHSRRGCSYNRDWGYHGRTLWVDNGCRATFRVEMRNGGGGRPAPGPRPRPRRIDGDDVGRALVGAAAGLIIGEIIDDLND